MFIRTERLFLRPCWPEDMEELFDALNDDQVASDLAGVPLPANIDEAQTYLLEPRDKLLPQFFIYSREKSGCRLVGGIGLGRMGPDVELGYWIMRSYRGRGYAAEAVQAVLRQARVLGHKRIVASQSMGDAVSSNVLERTGFTASGSALCDTNVGRRSELPAQRFVADLESMSRETMRAEPGLA